MAAFSTDKLSYNTNKGVVKIQGVIAVQGNVIKPCHPNGSNFFYAQSIVIAANVQDNNVIVKQDENTHATPGTIYVGDNGTLEFGSYDQLEEFYDNVKVKSLKSNDIQVYINIKIKDDVVKFEFLSETTLDKIKQKLSKPITELSNIFYKNNNPEIDGKLISLLNTTNKHKYVQENLSSQVKSKFEDFSILNYQKLAAISNLQCLPGLTEDTTLLIFSFLGNPRQHLELEAEKLKDASETNVTATYTYVEQIGEVL